MGFLPAGVGDALSLVAMVLGLPGIILYFLNKNQANRKLVVEEGGLTVEQFNAALPAYRDLLDRANADRKVAIETMETYKTEWDDVMAKQDRILQLLSRIVARGNITLTPEEVAELEATRPRRNLPRPATT